MDDPRLQAAAQAFSRLTTIADACATDGATRWTAALDRQAKLLDALNDRGVQLAQSPPKPPPRPSLPSAGSKGGGDGQQAG
jgi:hypothetical protein